MIYDIDPTALKFYRKDAKRHNDKPDDFIKRRLTCIIYSSEQNHLYNKVYLCKFSGFRIVADHKNKKIIHLYWLRKDNRGKRPSKKQLETLSYWQKKLLARANTEEVTLCAKNTTTT